MSRVSFPTDATPKMPMSQINTLLREYWLLTDSSSLKEMTTTQNKLTNPCESASSINTILLHKQNRLDPQTYTHEHKTDNWKQHFDKIDHKPNPHSLLGTTVKLFNKKITHLKAFALE